jgi:hypothetical protein
MAFFLFLFRPPTRLSLSHLSTFSKQTTVEALMGTLRAAKKRAVVHFEGQLLLQGVHDDVDVILLPEPAAAAAAVPAAAPSAVPAAAAAVPAASPSAVPAAAPSAVSAAAPSAVPAAAPSAVHAVPAVPAVVAP